MVAHVIVGRTILVADTLFDDGLAGGYAVEEVPTVVGVVPCSATDIMVGGTAVLLVGKAVCIATEVALR